MQNNDILKLTLDCDNKKFSIQNLRTKEIFNLKKPHKDSDKPLYFSFVTYFKSDTKIRLIKIE